MEILYTTCDFHVSEDQGEEDEFFQVSEVHGVMRAIENSENSDELNDVDVGDLSAYIIRISQMEQWGVRLPKNSLGWCIGEPDAEAAMGFVIEDGWISDKFEKLGEEYFLASTVMYVDTVKIKKEFRGHDYGLKLFHNFIKTFGGISPHSLVICKPYPINGFESDFDHSDGKKRLRKHWRRLGMQRIEKSPYYAMLAGQLQPFSKISALPV